MADRKRGGQKRNLHISEKLRLARELKDKKAAKKAGTVSAAKRAMMTPQKLTETDYYKQKMALNRLRA